MMPTQFEDRANIRAILPARVAYDLAIMLHEVICAKEIGRAHV